LEGEITAVAVAVVALALYFDFTNGFHDAANQVATVIASRALSPNWALFLAAIANFIGAYYLGTAVAQTMGKGIIDPTLLAAGREGVYVIIAALLGATFWNLFTWYFGIPSSSSHALIGGLIGAFIMGWGTGPINWPNVWKIIAIMILSPVVGFLACLLFTKMTLAASSRATPKVNHTFKMLQIVSSITQALAHGTNDAQKTMGVIMFSLVILGFYSTSAIVIPSASNQFLVRTLMSPPPGVKAEAMDNALASTLASAQGQETVTLTSAQSKRLIALLETSAVKTAEGAPSPEEQKRALKGLKAFSIPGWVIFTCSLAMAAGTLSGGKRIIKKLGAGLYKVRPIHGFASQVVATIIIETAAVLGFPLSTTQVISSSVMGAGAAFRPKMIRWKVANDMAMAWLITIPMSGLIAAAFFYLEKLIFLGHF
jgi:phosphate/sulfate permease